MFSVPVPKFPVLANRFWLAPATQPEQKFHRPFSSTRQLLLSVLSILLPAPFGLRVLLFHCIVGLSDTVHPIYLGTDVPDSDHLIAYGRESEEICKMIGADSLAYLDIKRLPELTGGKQFCQGCFTGEWPSPPPEEDIRGEHEA